VWLLRDDWWSLSRGAKSQTKQPDSPPDRSEPFCIPLCCGAAGASDSSMNDLPDEVLHRILQRSLAEMDAALLPWLRLSLVCKYASRFR